MKAIANTFNISTRRVTGLFASIVENGSMISLAGKWKSGKYIKDIHLTGLETKVIERKGKSEILYRFPGLADLASVFGWRVLSFSFPNRVKFTRRLIQLYRFCNYVYRMYKLHGPVQTVSFLKAAQLALQKSIARDRVDNLRQLDSTVIKSRLKGNGLPTIISSRDRKLIAAESPSIIRWWNTLFAVYRVIEIPGTLKLYTIVQPSTVTASDMANIASQFTCFLRQGSMKSMFNTRKMFREARLLFLETASPTHKVSWLGIGSNPKLLSLLGLNKPLEAILTLLGQSTLLSLFQSLVVLSKRDPLETTPTRGAEDGIFKDTDCIDPKGRFAGKLSIKEEAAGKRRVFALVDIWTQTALKPVHDMLFNFLKSLPNDGTFNQEASEMRAREKSLLAGRSYGYDLTAATDRLPIELQKIVLNLLLPTLGDHWASLLVDRDYFLYLPDDVLSSSLKRAALYGDPVPATYEVGGGFTAPVQYDLKGRPYVVLRYSTGQPMGALSSWAMLAVTHHFIVQLAYRRANGVPFQIPFGFDWYDNYELLGDDIILFEERVATEYLALMDEIGVPINVTKSVVATIPATEFAKVTSLRGKNVSALSWKMFMSGNSLMGRVNIAHYLLSRRVVTTRIIPWLERSLAQSRHKVGNITPSYLALWTMMANKGVITLEDALRALISGKSFLDATKVAKDRVFRLARAILIDADVTKIRLALPGLVTKGKAKFFEHRLVKEIFNVELPWFKITMWKPLAVFCAKADMQKDAETLTRQILRSGVLWGVNPLINWTDEMLDKICTLELDLGNYYVDGAPVTETSFTSTTGEIYSLPDAELNDYRVLYASILRIVTEKVESLGQPILDGKPMLDSPTDLLVDLRDKLDRYQEALELEARADMKLSTEDSPPARNVRPTELKLIKLIQKMGNRPLFTTYQL